LTDDQTARQEADAPVDGESPAAPDGAESLDRSWSNLWQIPTIVVSLTLIVGGIVIARRGAPTHDFEGAYAQIEDLVGTGQFELAADLLEESVAPHLDEATDAERGRFFAIAGDILALSMDWEETWPAEELNKVVDRYRRAEDLAGSLSATRVERWAKSWIRLGQLDASRRQLEKLDAMALDGADGAAAARNRVLRRLVEESLRRPDTGFEEAMAVLDRYRSDKRLRREDDIWAAARQAELRLRVGRVPEAINHVQVDMRRLEGAGPPERDPAFAEFYIMLSRAYNAHGDADFAETQARIAFDLIDPTSPLAAEALLALGESLLSQSRFEEALEHFQRIDTDYAGTPAHRPGLLGRAVALGVLGRHEMSLADFRQLAVNTPPETRPWRVSPERVIDALIDRHDAALATRQLDLALEYIQISERFLPVESLPEAALYRLASTNRAIAESIERRAGADERGAEMDPEIRRKVSRHYHQAAKYFVAHAGAVEAVPTEARSWLDSIWNAADCYDLAGYYDEAIIYFTRYVEGRSDIDPRRLEGRFRLAQCHQASLDDEQAAALYEGIIRDNPESPFATRSHVPLARCYVALDRPSQAEQQLLTVVSGGAPLKPEALDYRDALVELGTLYYNQRDFTRAIEELSTALQLYPNHPDATELRFRLADSYRGNGREIQAMLDSERMPRSRELELRDLRKVQLETAMDLFAQVRDAYGRTPQGELDVLEQDYQRYAHFYVADCAYELGRFERAIELYDRAARRYDKHPSSMIALIQIVNAYTSLGDRERALTAHNRALLRLQQMPEGALDTTDSILGEEAWRRWLEALPPGLGLTAETAAGG